MPDAVHRGISAGAFALALLACASASGQQGEPIGSWWLVDTSIAGAPRHAIMTLSTQGSGVIAIQCAAGKSTVLLGLNKPELRPSSGPILAVDYQIGLPSGNAAVRCLSPRTQSSSTSVLPTRS